MGGSLVRLGHSLARVNGVGVTQKTRLQGDFDIWHGRVVVNIRLQSTDIVNDYAIRVQLFSVIAVLRVDVMDEDTYEELYEFLPNNTYPDIDQQMVTILHGISSSGSLLSCATASCSMLTACDRIRRCRSMWYVSYCSCFAAKSTTTASCKST